MHPDLPYEQAYFDRALALRDRQQADLARAPSMAANPRAAVELRKRVSRLGLADPDEAIAFGRIEAADDRWYIGKGAIWDDDNDLVVVNWQAPIAAPFYTATPDDPEGLDARRLYRCSGNQIREIEDLMFREVADAIASGRPPEPVLSDALLESLGAARAGELGDIVATIQAAQYEVISRPLDELLVVQGGPGTGKTVVGLHRVSWLLFNRRDRLDARDVLVVGPNPAFVRVHLVGAALAGRRGRRAAADAGTRPAGAHRSGRSARAAAAQGRPPPAAPDPARACATASGSRPSRSRSPSTGRPSSSTAAASPRGPGSWPAARTTRATGCCGRSSWPRRPRPLTRGPLPAVPTLRGEAVRDIDNYLDRVWPSLTPQTFLVELCSSRRQLLAAGAGTLSEAELDMLALPTGTQVTSW